VDSLRRFQRIDDRTLLHSPHTIDENQQEKQESSSHQIQKVGSKFPFKRDKNASERQYERRYSLQANTTVLVALKYARLSGSNLKTLPSSLPIAVKEPHRTSHTEINAQPVKLFRHGSSRGDVNALALEKHLLHSKTNSPAFSKTASQVMMLTNHIKSAKLIKRDRFFRAVLSASVVRIFDHM